MNYFLLLARLLLVAYGGFLMLFAFGEGIKNEGLVHAVLPAITFFILILLWSKPIWSSVATALLFIISIWFFETHKQLDVFLIISGPLIVASMLFLIGSWRNLKSEV